MTSVGPATKYGWVLGGLGKVRDVPITPTPVGSPKASELDRVASAQYTLSGMVPIG